MNIQASDGKDTPRRRKTDKAPAIASRALLTLIIVLTGSASLVTLIRQAGDSGDNATRDLARTYQRCEQNRSKDKKDNTIQTDALNATYDTYNRIRTVLHSENLDPNIRREFERSLAFAKIRYNRKLTSITDPVTRQAVRRRLEQDGAIIETVVFTPIIDCARTYPGGKAASADYPDEAPVEPAGGAPVYQNGS